MIDSGVHSIWGIRLGSGPTLGGIINGNLFTQFWTSLCYFNDVTMSYLNFRLLVFFFR